MSLGTLASLIEGRHYLFNSDELRSSRINANDFSVCIHTYMHILYKVFIPISNNWSHQVLRF